MTHRRRYFNYESIWECRMSRKHRLYTTEPKLPLEILGFGSRGDKTMFSTE